jgi:hypothetical protein
MRSEKRRRRCAAGQDRDVGIAQELELLIREPETGKSCVDAVAARAALAGALLADLLIERRIARNERGKLVVVDRSPLGDFVLDRTLVTMASDPKPRSIARWVARLERSGVREDVLGTLVAHGDVEACAHRIFGLFPTTRYPVTNARAREQAMQSIHNALVAKGPVPDRGSALVGLCDAAGLLKQLVGPVERHRLRPFRDVDVARAVRASIAEKRSSSSDGGMAAMGSGGDSSS